MSQANYDAFVATKWWQILKGEIEKRMWEKSNVANSLKFEDLEERYTLSRKEFASFEYQALKKLLDMVEDIRK